MRHPLLETFNPREGCSQFPACDRRRYNAGMSATQTDPDFNGLTEFRPSLPAQFYFDPARHEVEMQRIWHRHWVYVARSQEVPAPRSYRTFPIAGQNVLLVRDDRGVLRAFHNTCRHRGAQLCTQESGALHGNGITCPYHAWNYGLDGALRRTTSRFTAKGFDPRKLSLYPVSVKEWRGFVFISLAAEPPAFADSFDVPLDRMNGWPMEDLKTGHVSTQVIRCNWKIFWENYNECLHCPGVHPSLSALVPIYGRAIMEPRDDPNWQEHADQDDPKYRGGVRAGARTWSRSGDLVGKPFPGLSEADRRTAYVFMTGLPSIYIVGHPDYVRVVRIRPLDPESTELRIEYLFAAETLADPAFALDEVTSFAGRVLAEDAAVCELNQAGLHALPLKEGVLMPEEYVIAQFHDWLRAETG